MKISERTRSLGDDSMVTREDRLLMGDLAKALTSAFVASGRRRKIVPASIRSQLIDLLPRLLGDPTLLREYTQAVRDERRRQTVDEILLILPGEEIPVRQIAANGFQSLDDAVLADLALCPEYLETLQEELYDNPELDAVKGDWLFTAQEQASRMAVPSSWKPTVVTVIEPTKSYRKWWLCIGAVVAVGILLGGIGLIFNPFHSSDRTQEPSMDPSEYPRLVMPKTGQIAVVSRPLGKLPVTIDDFEMMESSNPETPYRLRISASEPVYLMHVFCWESASPLWFEWHGSNRERQLPTGTSVVDYPEDRRFHRGFAGYLLVFTSVPIPNEFWKVLESRSNEEMKAARIDHVRDFLFAEITKAGVLENQIFIFPAVHSLVNKE